MFYELYIRASKKDWEKAGFEVARPFDFEGKVAVYATTSNLPLAYEDEPIADDQVTFLVSSVINQYLDWYPALTDIIFRIADMKEAQKQNDMEAFHEQEEILRSYDVIRFLKRVCELDKFSIYILEEDGLIKERIKYTKDMDILPLVLRALDYDAPQDIEIYAR